MLTYKSKKCPYLTKLYGVCYILFQYPSVRDIKKFALKYQNFLAGEKKYCGCPLVQCVCTSIIDS